MSNIIVADDNVTWYAFDIETSVNNQPEFTNTLIGSFPGNPFHPDNKVVLAGLLNLDDFEEYYESPVLKKLPTHIVGHNLSFDLMYYVNHYGPESLKDLVLWDTQIAEYMLTGQQTKQASLNQLADKYVGEQKIDVVKQLWDEGYRTEDIPKDVLSEYLYTDCNLTARIAKEQMKQMRSFGMLKLFEDRMRSLKATILMTWTGIWVDLRQCGELLVGVQNKEDELREQIEYEMAVMFGDTIKPNAGSPKQLKAFLFGGEAGKYKVDVPVLDENGNQVVYKTGQRKGEPKFKKAERTLIIQQGIITDAVTSAGTADDILAFYPDHPVVSLIRDWRKANKEKTMIESYYKHIIVQGEDIGVMHPQFNHAITVTGRLSSSNPNVQNLSNKEHDL